MASAVPSVARALRILELLAESRRGLTLSDICRRLTLPKSSVHLLAKTLESAGYLQINQSNSRYCFGPKLVSLSYSALANLGLREQAMPYLQDLMLKTGLTVHMAILEKLEVVIIEKVEAPGLLRFATWVGRRLDASSSGVGKALLAFTSEEDLRRFFAGRSLARYNRNTIASPGRLARELQKAKELGYAFEDQEGEIGIRCIGAPVFGGDGRAICAISVAGTTGQIPKSDIEKLATAVMKTASAISVRLGHRLGEAAAGSESDNLAPQCEDEQPQSHNLL